jgi:hypothetical protein
MDPGMKCHAEVVQVENCLTHVTSYIKYADHINKISLYESRLNRIIVRNTELLNKRQADRPNRVKQPEAIPIAEPIARTASAAAKQSKTLKAENGFALTNRPGLRSGSLIPTLQIRRGNFWSGQKHPPSSPLSRSSTSQKLPETLPQR